MRDGQQRTLSKCIHKFVNTNCKKCGIFYHEGNKSVKTNLFDSYFNCSAHKYLKHLRKRQCEIINIKQIHEGSWKLLLGICSKFSYSLETLALGIYIFAKTDWKKEKDQKFWVTVTLLVASKAIELDKRVPYINRYQKYAQKSFSQNQYEVAQKNILEQMDFDVQFSTFISFLHFYMTNGFLYQKDNLKESTIINIEDELLNKAKERMKTGQFVSQNPQKLALSLIKETRLQNKLEPWNKQLQRLSEQKFELVGCTLHRNNVLKPLCYLSMRAKEKANIMPLTKALMSLQSSGQLTNQKPKLLRRRNDTLLKYNMKQNLFQAEPPISHQTVVHNQGISMEKRRTSNLSIHANFSSSQRLMPLIIGHNRRL